MNGPHTNTHIPPIGFSIIGYTNWIKGTTLEALTNRQYYALLGGEMDSDEFTRITDSMGGFYCLFYYTDVDYLLNLPAYPYPYSPLIYTPI
jgi:hypothetical protein